MSQNQKLMERVAGIEPASSAWKAEVIATIRYPRDSAHIAKKLKMVEGGGFEPPKAEPSDLQSDPFGHSGTPPILIQQPFFQAQAFSPLYKWLQNNLIAYIIRSIPRKLAR